MKKAYVTVYFTLTISVCMGLIFALFTGIKENAARMRTREVMQISMDSAFGEYNRYIWENYKLIFVDSGFDSRVNSAILAEDHFTECMNKNFDEGGSNIIGERDLTNLICRGTEFDRIRLATDEKGAAIQNQAIEYMRYTTKLEYISDLYEELKECNENCDIDSFREQYEAAKSQLGEEDCQTIFTEIEVSENQVFLEKDGSLSTFSILNTVISNPSTVSGTKMNKDTLYTEREHNVGNYGVSGNLSLVDESLYREYFMRVCSNYMNELDNSCMSYEVEYLIEGNEQDNQNLQSVVIRILLAREAANLASFKKDSIKTAEVEAAATVIASILLNPELIEPIKALITTVWVHLESMADIRGIMNGERRPFIKERSEWQTGLSFSSSDSNKTDTGRGMNYEDYLRAFLLIESNDILTDRFINLIELNVRENTQYSDFRMDLCFDACEVTSYVECMNGGNYIITRVKDVENH